MSYDLKSWSCVRFKTADSCYPSSKDYVKEAIAKGMMEDIVKPIANEMVDEIEATMFGESRPAKKKRRKGRGKKR